MNLYYSTKRWLKMARWKARRQVAARRWGSTLLERAPAVVGNAMPKSGSHLISQVLQGLPLLGPFVNPGFPPLNRTEDNRILPEDAILANIQRMQPGDIAYGYLQARDPYLSELIRPGRATVFVYRDPRDMIVSHVFYATQMHSGHGMHHYYTEELTSMEARINAAISGVQVPGSELSPVKTRYDGYLGWLNQPQVLCLRFEQLIEDRETTFGRLLDYLVERGLVLQTPREGAIVTLRKAVVPRKSGTFRRGKPGGWREHFTDRNKALFKESTGDLLARLGYETGNDW